MPVYFQVDMSHDIGPALMTLPLMMTSSNGNIFRVTGPLDGEFTGHGEFPAQRPVTQNFDVFFDLRLNKRLSKQPWGWWLETPSWSLWRHCNVTNGIQTVSSFIPGSRDSVAKYMIKKGNLHSNVHSVVNFQSESLKAYIDMLNFTSTLRIHSIYVTWFVLLNPCFELSD